MSKDRDKCRDLEAQIKHLIDEYTSVNKMTYPQIIMVLEVLKLDNYNEMISGYVEDECCDCQDCQDNDNSSTS